MIVENICCQGSVLGYEVYFRSKEYKDNYRIYKFGDRKIVAAYWTGTNITSKSIMKIRPDGKYNVLYVNHLKGNVFSI